MSEQELMDFFPPVHASTVYKRETQSLSPLQTKADGSMLFVLASVTVFAVIFILAAVVMAVS